MCSFKHSLLGLAQTERQTRHSRDWRSRLFNILSILVHLPSLLTTSFFLYTVSRSLLYSVLCLASYRVQQIPLVTTHYGKWWWWWLQCNHRQNVIMGVELFLRKRKTTTCGVEVLSTSFNLTDCACDFLFFSLQVLECWGFLQYVSVAMPVIIKFPLLH